MQGESANFIKNQNAAVFLQSCGFKENKTAALAQSAAVCDSG
jgi:hypothetical protein